MNQENRNKGKNVIKRRLGLLLAVLAAVGLESGSLSAMTEAQDAWAGYVKVAENYGSRIADQLSAQAGFSASSGDITTAEILPFSRIRITTGLGLSAGLWDRSMTQELGKFSAQTLAIPAVLPLAAGQFGIRMGLPGQGLTDIGFRIGGLARSRVKVGEGIKASVMNQTFGVSIRQKLVGTASKGIMALGFGFSSARGDIALSRTHDDAILGTYGAASGSREMNFKGETSQVNAWAVNTWSTSLRISKKMKGFHPWLGISRQWYVGKASSEFSGNGAISLVNQNTNAGGSETVSTRSSVVKAAKTGDTKFIAGFLKTLGPIAWTLQVESELKNKHAVFIGIASGI